MSNDEGNPQIAEYGKATRFVVGGRNCPVVAQRRASPPWAITRAVRRILSHTFDDPDNLTLDDLLRIFCPRGRHVTGAQLIAIRLFWAAVKEENLGAMQRLTYMSDGLPSEVTTEYGY